MGNVECGREACCKKLGKDGEINLSSRKAFDAVAIEVPNPRKGRGASSGLNRSNSQSRSPAVALPEIPPEPDLVISGKVIAEEDARAGEVPIQGEPFIESNDVIIENPQDDNQGALAIIPETPQSNATSRTTPMSARSVRAFRFKANGIVHTVEIYHQACVWYIDFDGGTMQTFQHTNDSQDMSKIHQFEFQVPEFSEEASLPPATRQGQTLSVLCSAKWSKQRYRWCYAVQVNSIQVPPWLGNSGKNTPQCCYVPDVLDTAKNLYNNDEISSSISDLSVIQGADKQAGFKINRVFLFQLCDEIRGIEVAHENKVWYILVDGIAVKQIDHRNADKSAGLACVSTEAGKKQGSLVYGCDFLVKLPTGGEVTASMKMEWSSSKFLWTYALVVNGKFVPECGYKGSPVHPKEHFAIDIPTVSTDATPLAITDGGEESSAWKAVNWNEHEALQLEKAQKDLKAPDGKFKTARVYHFTTHRRFRSVAILHANCKWQFVVDGVIQKEMVHGSALFSGKTYSTEFEVHMENGEQPLKVDMQMEWKPRQFQWFYVCTINNLIVAPVYSCISEVSAPIVELVDTNAPPALKAEPEPIVEEPAPAPPPPQPPAPQPPQPPAPPPPPIVLIDEI